MFSLGGMPLLAGFLTKFILFQAAALDGFLWLATLAVIMSTISLYYYLMVIKQMYLYEPDGDASRWRLSVAGYVVTGALLAGTVFIGVYAGPVYEAADRASKVLFT